MLPITELSVANTIQIWLGIYKRTMIVNFAVFAFC